MDWWVINNTYSKADWQTFYFLTTFVCVGKQIIGSLKQIIGNHGFNSKEGQLRGQVSISLLMLEGKLAIMVANDTRWPLVAEMYVILHRKMKIPWPDAVLNSVIKSSVLNCLPSFHWCRSKKHVFTLTRLKSHHLSTGIAILYTDADDSRWRSATNYNFYKNTHGLKTDCKSFITVKTTVKMCRKVYSLLYFQITSPDWPRSSGQAWCCRWLSGTASSAAATATASTCGWTARWALSPCSHTPTLTQPATLLLS